MHAHDTDAFLLGIYTKLERMDSQDRAKRAALHLGNDDAEGLVGSHELPDALLP